MRFVKFTGEILENFKGGARQRVKRLVAEMSPAAKPSLPTVRDNSVLPIALYENGVADARHQDCHRGHIIALEFGGPEKNSNLVPMYGSFNSAGTWRKFETELADWVNSADVLCEVTVVCDYSSDANEDQRVPTSFTVTVKGLQDPHKSRTRLWAIPHPKPVPVAIGADPTKKAEYLALIKEMQDANWGIQSHLNMSGMPTYRKAPQFPFGPRPYAFLDYAAWKAVKDNPKALQAWSDSVVLAQTDDFSPEQIAKIREVNRVLHDGFYMSDDPDDPAYKELRYRVPGHPPGLLVEGGHDLTPQVDHVIPQSATGAAVYSNAMLISAKHNSNKRARMSIEDETALSNVPRGTGRPKKYTDRYTPY